MKLTNYSMIKGQRRKMMTNKQDNKIKIKVYEAKQPTQILLCLHGFAGDKESSVIEAIGTNLQKNYITTIAFDWPCHGEDENKDKLTIELCFDYLEEIVDLIKSKNNLPINIFATSFGAYLFLHYLTITNEKFNKVILRAPAIDMQHIIYKIIKEHGYSENDAKTKILNLGYGREVLLDKTFISQLKLPVFNLQNKPFLYIIQGKKDDLVDYKFNEEYLKNNFLKKHKVYYFNGADHRFKNPGEKEKIIEIVRQIILQ